MKMCEREHPTAVRRVPAKKYFFECVKCESREEQFDNALCVRTCKCGGEMWRGASAKVVPKVKDTGPVLLPRGEEHAFSLRQM